MNNKQNNIWNGTFEDFRMNVYDKQLGYFNSNSGKWGFRIIKDDKIIKGRYRRLEFECFNDKMIYECFNRFDYIDKVSYFLTLLYNRSVKVIKRNESSYYENGIINQWIYFSVNNSLKQIFNSTDYIDVLLELEYPSCLS